MKKIKNQERGITLIALIITIVVMLILVAVTVTTIVQSNLIGNTEKATKGWKDAESKEGQIGQVEINGDKYDSVEDYVQGVKTGEKNS